MTRFILVDNNGTEQRIEVEVSVDTMRAWLSEFKTHCAITNGSYVFLHFSNWVTKYYGHKLKYWNTLDPQRVDM